MGVNASYAQTKSYGATVRNANTSLLMDLTAMYNMWGYRSFSGNKSIDEYFNENIDDEIHGSFGNRVNPITTLKTEEREYINYNTNVNTYVNINIMKNLLWRSTIGFDRRQNQNEIYYGKGHPATMMSGGAAKGINGSAQYTISTRLLNENTLTYTNTFKDKHNLTALAGLTVQDSRYSNFKGEAWYIIRDMGITALDESADGTQPLVSSKTENSLFSLLSRIQYNYDSRYYFTASIRRDASSRFPSNNRYGYFPSAALMYRISQENFMKQFVFISDMSLRTSYGETGNDRTSGNYDYLPELNISSSKGYSWGNGAITQGAESGKIGNDRLKWETTKTWDVGLNISLFNQRLDLEVDYYDKKTMDLLMRSKMPPSSGYSTAMKNIGSVQNRGWEFTVNAVIAHNKNFMFSSNFNISFNRSKVLSLSDGENSLLTSISWNNNFNGVPLYIAQVGQPIAMFYGMRWVGNYQINDFTWQNNSDSSIPHADRNYVLKENVPSNGMVREQIKPGYIKYADMTNSELNSIDSDDRIIIGNPNPKFTGGMSNNFKYKDFDLNLFFQFSYGAEVMNANRILFEGTNRYGLNQFASYADRWAPDNAASKNHVPAGGNNYYSDRTIEDASYIRLKTVQLGYTLPNKIAQGIFLQGARFYVSAQNIFTWTKYSGFDPEVSIYNSALTPNLDYLSYPRAMTFTAGISVTF
jgi:TonB-linked SusC/RagA family outer membrane protein